jgi:hypothetical protein
MATRIEILDVGARAALVSQTVPYVSMIALGDGYFSAYTETPEGEPGLIVLRATVVNQVRR